MTDATGFLISDVSRLMRRQFDQRARMIGVTRTQWRTLTTVARNEGINQGGLADLLEVEPITLCRMIDRLAEARLVERRRDPADRRAWQIFLTERAHPLIDQLRDIGNALIEEALAGLDAPARDGLMQSLTMIRANLASVSEPRETANG